MKKPWEFDNRLTEDRLLVIAKALKEGRDSACDTLDLEDLDERWSLACVAFIRAKNTIQRTAESGDVPWLKVESPRLDFVFSIGGVPCRFFRDDPDAPSKKIMKVSELEPLLPFMEEIDAAPTLWRFIVEPDVEGRTMRIALLGLNGLSHILSRWEVLAVSLTSDDGVNDSWAADQAREANDGPSVKPRKPRDQERG